MILPTMTGREMIEHMTRDYDLMEGKVQALERDFRHTLKKYPLTKFVIHHYTVRDSHQEYLIVNSHIGKDRNHGLMRSRFAIVQDGDKKLYITMRLGNTDVQITTHHFFERYRERMQLGDVSIEQAIGIHTYKSSTLLNLYSDDDGHFVFASSEGISLCEFDGDCTMWFRTFVSADMLKLSQFKSWNKVQEDIARADEYVSRQGCIFNTYHEEMIRKLYGKLDNIELTEAQEIYAKYFEK